MVFYVVAFVHYMKKINQFAWAELHEFKDSSINGCMSGGIVGLASATGTQTRYNFREINAKILYLVPSELESCLLVSAQNALMKTYFSNIF